MKINKVIEHLTKAVNKYADESILTAKQIWEDLIIRECEEGNVEILFDGGYCYDIINETWSDYGGDMVWENAEKIFGLKELEKLGHEAEPYASWKISVYKR